MQGKRVRAVAAVFVVGSYCFMFFKFFYSLLNCVFIYLYFLLIFSFIFILLILLLLFLFFFH